MKKIWLLSLLSSNDISNKSILKLQSSKVLSNFQGKMHEQFNYMNSSISITRIVKRVNSSITQIMKNSFSLIVMTRFIINIIKLIYYTLCLLISKSLQDLYDKQRNNESPVIAPKKAPKLHYPYCETP